MASPREEGDEDKLTLLTEVTEALKKDARLTADGKLLKNKIMELALKLDSELLKIMASNKVLKENFFVEVSGTFFFDRDKFIKFVDNKSFLPDSYTVFKNKIGLSTNGREVSKSGEVVLVWPHKDCVLEGGMESVERERERERESRFSTTKPLLQMR